MYLVLTIRNAIPLTELTGIDLFMADIKALEAYISYFYSLSKIWEKPLPEVYAPEDVADYFSCRPHVVALRLIEVNEGHFFKNFWLLFFFGRVLG